MAPLLISPFKSPISVFSRLKDWSARKRLREDNVSATPMLEACRQCSSTDAPGSHSATSFCTPRLGRCLSIATPDSGIQSQPTSAVTDRLAQSCSKVSSTPIPICKGNASCQYPRMQMLSSALAQKNIESETDTEYNGGQFTEQLLVTQAPPDNARRVSTASSISAVAPSETTTTTTITSETSSSTRSDGDSWCLKLSDLDNADCLSPAKSSGWARSFSDYIKTRGFDVDSSIELKAGVYSECCELEQCLVGERSERHTGEEHALPTKHVNSCGTPKPQVEIGIWVILHADDFEGLVARDSSTWS